MRLTYPARGTLWWGQQARRNLHQPSAQLCNQKALPEALASWAQRVLLIKEQLSAIDAETLENAFVKRLVHIEASRSCAASEGPKGQDQSPTKGAPPTQTVMVIGKPVRERDSDHLRFVASQACLICGRSPSDAHHIKFAEARAMGRKVSDRFTVPICRLHHRDLHRGGNERAWWRSKEIEPLSVAAGLWEKTHAGHSTVHQTADCDEPAIELNGRYFEVGERRNDETKPIVRPEAR